MKILVLGISGMLGNAVFKVLGENNYFKVYGTLRNSQNMRYFSKLANSRIIINIDVLEQDALIAAIEKVRPDVVVNCVGLIKQLSDVKNPLLVLPVNSMLPHRLNKLCGLANARLIHISTDCVFSGHKGMYRESDPSDAEDLYGKSKHIGEVNDSNNAVTLRTSIIGHELNSRHALVEWFLSREDTVSGFTKAIFSGVPTVELARIIERFVLPNAKLNGLYHVSAEPIDKYSLLKHIAEVYGKEVEIIPDESVSIDRSLNSDRFKAATGYAPPPWRELINLMHSQR